MEITKQRNAFSSNGVTYSKRSSADACSPEPKQVTYKTIFLLTITYPFPATFLSKTILEKAQSLTMPLILSKLGYN